MSISLLEEFLLLTLEDEGGQVDTVSEIFLTEGVAGASVVFRCGGAAYGRIGRTDA